MRDSAAFQRGRVRFTGKTAPRRAELRLINFLAWDQRVHGGGRTAGFNYNPKKTLPSKEIRRDPDFRKSPDHEPENPRSHRAETYSGRYRESLSFGKRSRI